MNERGLCSAREPSLESGAIQLRRRMLSHCAPVAKALGMRGAAFAAPATSLVAVARPVLPAQATGCAKHVYQFSDPCAAPSTHERQNGNAERIDVNAPIDTPAPLDRVRRVFRGARAIDVTHPSDLGDAFDDVFIAHVDGDPKRYCMVAVSNEEASLALNNPSKPGNVDLAPVFADHSSMLPRQDISGDPDRGDLCGYARNLEMVLEAAGKPL